MAGNLHPITAVALQSDDGRGLPAFFAEPGFEGLIDNLRGPYEVLRDWDGVRTARAASDREQLIVRMIGDDESSADIPAMEALTLRAAALARGLGIRGLEQMVTYSLGDPDYPIVVTRFEAGETLDELEIAQVGSITENHLKGLLDSVEEGVTRRVAPDTGVADNFLHHPTRGFAVIDYYSDTEAGKLESGTQGHFCEVLSLVSEIIHPSTDRLYRQVWLDTARRGIAVLRERYPDAIEELPDIRYRTRDWLLNAEKGLIV